jgi:hypothetical protein
MNRFILYFRHIDSGELARTQQAGPLTGVTPVGCDPSARLLGDQRGGHDPAAVARYVALARTLRALGCVKPLVRP